MRVCQSGGQKINYLERGEKKAEFTKDELILKGIDTKYIESQEYEEKCVY